MATFNFTTDSIVEAKAIFAALAGINADITTEIDVEAPIDTTDTTEVKLISPSEIAGMISELANMSQGELADIFDGADKPYRVIKAFSWEQINDKINYFAIPTTSSREDIDKAIDYIVKDVSVGGMAHDTMEDLFECRTSKTMFQNFSLDTIVNKLKENNKI